MESGVRVDATTAEAMEQFYTLKRSTAKAVKDFNSNFNDFQAENLKLSKEVWTTVTAYNILDNASSSAYPEIEKEEMLQEMLQRIQDKTSLIRDSILSMTKKLEKLEERQKTLRKQSATLNWNVKENPAIKGSVLHPPPTECLDHLSNLIFHFDVAITVINQYFDVLSLRQPKSYENLMKSFKISHEISAASNEFFMNNREQ